MIFSYDTLPTDQANRLQEIAGTVKRDMFGGVELTLHMGDVLIEAKEMIGHGQFMKWFELEFRNQWEVSLDTAERWMGLARNRELVELPFSLTVKYELIDAPPAVIPLLLAQNETKPVTADETRKAIASYKLRTQVEAYVEALQGAAPCEQPKVEAMAMAVLELIQQGFDNQKLRDEAKELYQEYGPQLNTWAKVIDNDMMATNRLTPPTPCGNGNGNTIWSSLEDMEHGCGKSVVIHVPVEIPNFDKKYIHYTIATFPDIQLMDNQKAVAAMNLQISFLNGGCAAIGLRVPELEEE